MENIRDWCISRQSGGATGFRCGIARACGKTIVAEETPIGCPWCGNEEIEQDQAF